MNLPQPDFHHLFRLSDDTGILEHALMCVPRREHGYCVDDVARALIVICREKSVSPNMTDLAGRYLAFLKNAMRVDGKFHNRFSYQREWLDDIGSDDCQGRALWALGTAATMAPTQELRDIAHRMFDEASTEFSSPYLRSNAFAALGAAKILEFYPKHKQAAELLESTVHNIINCLEPISERWLWPETRLAYDNARIPQALIAAGRIFEEPSTLSKGLLLLDWLVDIEWHKTHFSFTPVSGRGVDDLKPKFDQQPVEAAATTEACAESYLVTKNVIWAQRAITAANWFLGANDIGVSLYNRNTGGCFDGLHEDRVNLNQGAESTISCISAFQRGREVLQLRSMYQEKEDRNQLKTNFLN